MITQHAFPTQFEREAHGMTLRDYFAAKALPSIIEDWYRDELYIGDDDNAEFIAILAFKMADAMMEVRK